MAAYRLLWFVPLPNLSNPARTMLSDGVLGGFATTSIATLGLAPFIAGFLVVELYSLITPWGRKVRRRGFEGRSVLTRWSLQLSLFIAIIQAMGIVTGLASIVLRDNTPVLADPGFLPRMVLVVTLVATSFAVFALSRVMTQRGLGNGFCLLYLSDPLFGVVGSWLDSTRASYGAIPWGLVHGVVAVVVLTGLVHYLKASASLATPEGSEDHEQVSSWTLPSFPQGLVAASWALGLVQLLRFGLGSFGIPNDEPHASVISLVLLVVLIPFLSWVTVHFFSTRGRLEANLPEPTIPTGFETALNRRLLASTALLTTLVVSMGALGSFTYWSPVLDAVLLIGFAAFGVDLFEEWRFRRRHETVADLAVLDNVQLALHLRRTLQSRGIDTWTQALHYRSLIYFFGPLFKMTVLVPTDRIDEARELWNELDPKIV